MHDDEPLRGYEVTLVARTTNEHHLQPPVELPEGIAARVDGPEVLLTIPLRVPDARTALATARETATDLLLVLAATFNAYELVVDERQVIHRTDAVYQAEGPIPPLDVAEGRVSEYGEQFLDPDGELRRAGRVFMTRVSAFVTHPPAQDVRRFAGRAAWSIRLRRGLTLFHAAQNARDEIVAFTLTAAAMEVLADADESPLLDKLSDDAQAGLRKDLIYNQHLRRLDVNGSHRNRTGDREEWTERTHRFSEEHQDTVAYTPDDIPTVPAAGVVGEHYRRVFEAFCGEQAIKLTGEYCWIDPVLPAR